MFKNQEGKKLCKFKFRETDQWQFELLIDNCVDFGQKHTQKKLKDNVLRGKVMSDGISTKYYEFQDAIHVLKQMVDVAFA